MFWWGYKKSLVYADKTEVIEAVEENIVTNLGLNWCKKGSRIWKARQRALVRNYYYFFETNCQTFIFIMKLNSGPNTKFCAFLLFLKRKFLKNAVDDKQKDCLKEAARMIGRRKRSPLFYALDCTTFWNYAALLMDSTSILKLTDVKVKSQRFKWLVSQDKW